MQVQTYSPIRSFYNSTVVRPVKAIAAIVRQGIMFGLFLLCLNGAFNAYQQVTLGYSLSSASEVVNGLQAEKAVLNAKVYSLTAELSRVNGLLETEYAKGPVDKLFETRVVSSTVNGTKAAASAVADAAVTGYEATVAGANTVGAAISHGAQNGWERV